MFPTKRKVSQFLRGVRLVLVQDVPPEHQACESCRELTCDSVRAASCGYRMLAEKQEIRRRLVEFSKTGA